MEENKILLKELHKYKELEKQLEEITLQELVRIYQQDITRYNESSIGLRMLSSEDFEHYLNLLEEKSTWKYNIEELERYYAMEQQLQQYGTSVVEVVEEYLSKRER